MQRVQHVFKQNFSTYILRKITKSENFKVCVKFLFKNDNNIIVFQLTENLRNAAIKITPTAKWRDVQTIYIMHKDNIIYFNENTPEEQIKRLIQELINKQEKQCSVCLEKKLEMNTCPKCICYFCDICTFIMKKNIEMYDSNSQGVAEIQCPLCRYVISDRVMVI